jgi:uncharacterized protein (TIGR03067 family)
MYRRAPGRSVLLAGLLAVLLPGSLSRLPAQGTEKKPLPPAREAVEEAAKEVKKIFKKEYEDAREDPAARVKLAGTFLTQARETKDDPPSRYVLLREARDLAASGGDLTLAGEVIEEALSSFSLDAGHFRAGAVLAAAPVVTGAKSKAVAEMALDVLTQVLQQDDLDTARQLLKAASEAAGRTKSLTLVTRVEARRKEVDAVAKALAQVKEYADALKKDPNDPKANLEMGKYLCLLRGNWDKGLPLLARGSDEDLKALAKKDLQRPRSSKTQTAVADAWWLRSEAEKDPVKLNFQGRAVYWYEQALPDLTGIAKVKTAKRLQEYNARSPRKVAVVDAKSELKKLQGSWLMVDMQGMGAAVPKELLNNFKLTFTADKISMDLGGLGGPGPVQMMSYKIDPTKKPKHIDLINENGPMKGEVVQGIYALEGDTLRICASEARKGKGRPADFPKVPTQDEPILVLKRVK